MRRPSLTNLQRDLLQVVQADFPLVERPYQELAERVGATEAEVLEALGELLQQGVIRELAPVFATRRMGYASTLAASSVPEGRVEEVAALINGYPEVTHNYLREHRYNLWFTVTAPSPERVAEVLAEIATQTGLTPLSLPTRRQFKIRVVFDFVVLDDRRDPLSPAHPSGASGLAGTLPRAAGESVEKPQIADRALLARLQQGLPLCSRPYEEMGKDCGLAEADVIARVRRLCEAGVIRRLGARVGHLRAGIQGNVMVAWRVPAERVEEVGERLAQEPAISHCYEREPQPELPYNVYTMVHGPNVAAVCRLVEELSRAVGISEYERLPTVRELKKSSPRYDSVTGEGE